MQDKSLPRKRPPTASKAKRSLSFSISILRELWKSSISYFLFDKNKEIKSFDMKKMVGIKEDFVCNCIGQPWEDICWQKIMKLPAFGNLRPWPSYVQQCTLMWHQIKSSNAEISKFFSIIFGQAKYTCLWRFPWAIFDLSSYKGGLAAFREVKEPKSYVIISKVAAATAFLNSWLSKNDAAKVNRKRSSHIP